MKVLLLTNHLNPGGITTYTVSLAEGLKKKGHLVKVASRGGEQLRRLRELGIEHIYLNLDTKSEASPRIFFAKRKLFAVLKNNRVDILHSQTRITRVLAQYIQNKLNIPFVSTAHGFYTSRLGSRLFPCWGERVIAISEAVKKDLISKFNLEQDRIKVIYNGINFEKFSRISNDSEKNKIKGNLGISTKEVIVSISRLSFIKGHLYLVRAMEKVTQEFPDAGCVIIGEGEAEGILEEEIKKLNLGERIKFLGSTGDTSKVLAIADIFVLPTMQEGLGLVILEAMAMGVPVIATNIGGIPEIIRDGENGVLVSPQDTLALSEAISKLFKDDALRARLAHNGRQTIVDKFSLEQMVDQTEEFYREILSKSNR